MDDKQQNEIVNDGLEAYCEKCGEKLSGESKFCCFCGSDRIKYIDPNKSEEKPEDVKEEPIEECSHESKKEPYCETCGEKLAEGSRFCAYCGSDKIVYEDPNKKEEKAQEPDNPEEESTSIAPDKQQKPMPETVDAKAKPVKDEGSLKEYIKNNKWIKILLAICVGLLFALVMFIVLTINANNAVKQAASTIAAKDAQISQKDEEIKKLGDELQSKDTEISEKDSNISELKKNLTDKQSQCTKLKEENSTLKDQSFAIENLKKYGSAGGIGAQSTSFCASDNFIVLKKNSRPKIVTITAAFDSCQLTMNVNGPAVLSDFNESTWYGNTTSIYIDPIWAGVSEITIRNNRNSKLIKIIVLVTD